MSDFLWLYLISIIIVLVMVAIVPNIPMSVVICGIRGNSSNRDSPGLANIIKCIHNGSAAKILKTVIVCNNFFILIAPFCSHITKNYHCNDDDSINNFIHHC